MEHALTEIVNYLVRQSWCIIPVFALVAAGCFVLRKASAHWRYLLWLVVLVKCLTPPLFNVPLRIFPQDRWVRAEEIAQVTGAAGRSVVQGKESLGMAETTDEARAFAAIEDASPSVLPPGEVSSSSEMLPSNAGAAASKPPTLTITQWLAVCWIAGLLASLSFTILKALRIHHRLNRSRRPIGPDLQEDVQRLSKRLNLRSAPKVWLVDGFSQPFAWGLLRGDIYLPGDFREGAREHREGILTHEMAHILRWDPAINTLELIIQSLFFFHPLVWWANKKTREEREKCCDEIAIVALSARPKQYGTAIVDALVREHQSRQPLPSLAIAGPVKNIEERIKTIMSPNRRFHRNPTRTSIVSVLLLTALTLPTALTLAGKAEGKGEAPRDPKKKTAKRDFVAILSNGATAELIAVSNLHAKDKQWWAPDGSIITQPPYGGMKNPLEQYHYELVIRFKGPSDASDRWDVPGGNTSTNTGRPKDEEGKYIEDLRVLGVGFRKAPETATVRYGTGMGKWETRASFQARQSSPVSHGFQAGGVVFNTPYMKEEEGVTVLNVAHTFLEPDTRVVSIGTDGSVRRAVSITGRGVTGMRSQTYRFRDVPLDQIEQFEFQTRPYEWVEFKNVSLSPGRKSHVQVIENRRGATTEIFPGVMRRYVGKNVSEFPTKVDLSTPEAAAATWNRAWATADTEAIVELSSGKITASKVRSFWKWRDAIYDKALLDSQVVEVLLYHRNLARVITYLRFPKGHARHPYSPRNFWLFNGKWKSLGEDGCQSVQAARHNFNKKKDHIYRYEKHARVMENPEEVVQAARKLFERIRDADYNYFLTSDKRDVRHEFPTVGYYMASRGHASLVKWICKTFKDNPITSIELGDVFIDPKVVIIGHNDLPTVPYKLTLKDGTVLEGNLPFNYEFDGGVPHWHGCEGIDWHLKSRKKPTTAPAG